MEPECDSCGGSIFEETGYGINFCVHCGMGKPGMPIVNETTFFRSDRVFPKQCYTRLKRFKKYMHRAMRMQSSSTIPQETWQYLLDHRPYTNAQHVQTVLKKARHLKRKCYDSLPFLTNALCPHIEVPELDQKEKARALHMFRKIDRAIKGPFVSYLYCLEYILRAMGRGDMCPYINRIQCPKRRARYKTKLDGIFLKTDSIREILRCNAVHSPKSL